MDTENTAKKMCKRCGKLPVCDFMGLTVAQIRQVLESGDKAGTITALLVEKEEQLHWQKNSFRALCDLAKNYDLDKAEREKKALEAKQNIREKLRLAFPGSYGDYLSLHFGKYLGEPLDTPEKEEAYRKMVSFLDGLQLKEISPGTGTIFDANHGVAAAADVEKSRRCGARSSGRSKRLSGTPWGAASGIHAVDANKGISNFSCGTNESTSGGFFKQQWLLQYFFTEFTDSQ